MSAYLLGPRLAAAGAGAGEEGRPAVDTSDLSFCAVLADTGAWLAPYAMTELDRSLVPADWLADTSARLASAGTPGMVARDPLG